MRRIIVIGGGASGLAAAVAAAEGGASVTVLEARRKSGRKLALSGNGRCNLTNLAFPDPMYHGSDPAFATRLLKENAGQLDAFFRSCGILTRTVGTGVYPYSEEAGSVVRNILARAEELGITIRNNTPACAVRKENGRFYVRSGNWEYEADAVILASGSPAFSDREEPSVSGTDLAASLGHSVNEMLPALVPLVLAGSDFSGWTGARARGSVTVFIDGKESGTASGQIQFTKYGISGIPVMDISGTAARALREGKEVKCVFDLAPEADIDFLSGFISKTVGRHSLPDGILPQRLMETICALPFKTSDPAVLAARLKGSVFRVAMTRPMEEAQCATGGIPVPEIDPATMESRKTDGLYLCGELLDIDGICGGYNLSFAFLTGLTAGRSASHD